MEYSKLMFIVLFSLLSIIRAYFRIRYHSLFNRNVFRVEPVGIILFRYITGTLLLVGTLGYILPYPLFPFAHVSLSPVSLIIGAVLGIASLAVILFAHLALGENFSTTTEIRGKHRLVTAGVYRFSRNPMYLAYCMLFIAAFLLSGNWIIGSSGLLIILSLMTVRLKEEERILLDRFGEEYHEYQGRTGRFFPRIPAEEVSKQIGAD